MVLNGLEKSQFKEDFMKSCNEDRDIGYLVSFHIQNNC